MHSLFSLSLFNTVQSICMKVCNKFEREREKERERERERLKERDILWQNPKIIKMNNIIDLAA